MTDTSDEPVREADADAASRGSAGFEPPIGVRVGGRPADGGVPR